MSGIRTGIFQNEQEYYQALTGWARELLASYALTHVKTSDGGLLRKNGGILITREELLAELGPELPASAGEKNYDPELLRTALADIREPGPGDYAQRRYDCDGISAAGLKVDGI